jgi:hypothetical protein
MQYLNTRHNQESWKWLMYPKSLLARPLLKGGTTGILFTLQGISVGFLSLLIMPVWAWVGYVDDVNGASTDFYLNGQKGRIYIGKQLNQGDKIQVLKKGASVKLLLGNESVYLTYTHKHPYTVPTPPPPKNGFLKVARHWLKGLFQFDDATTKAMTRGGSCQQKTPTPLSIPLLQVEKNAKLLEGERQLYVGWSGGYPPYQVQIHRFINGKKTEVKNLRTTFTQTCSSLLEVALKQWVFKKGELYQLKIIDAHQQSIQGQFRVVPDFQDPRWRWSPKETEELRTSSFLRAIWLARQGYGEWNLEAYQQVGRLKTHSARLIKRGLAEEGIPLSINQHALVVGINQYQYADNRKLFHLEGAVNDALLLQKVLRRADVQLPNRRVLLDNEATRGAFDRAWQDMLKTANPGDTLILTFSGHGGQQTDAPPLGEEDGKDETLLFHDFNPRNSTQGRITDDELYELFKNASAYNIVVVVDACHSSGMVRSVVRPSGRIRYGGFWQIESPSLSRSTSSKSDNDDNILPNVTLITAVERDSLKVPETIIDNNRHGALSWYFAKALQGKADGNQNGFLERHELSTFLREKVSNQMNNMQKPKVLPRADTKGIIRIVKLPISRVSSDIAIVVKPGNVPHGLKHVHLVKSSQTFDLLFAVNKQQTEVFNNTGDKVTTLPTVAVNRWQQIIDKERLLKVLTTQFDMRLQPIHITLREGDKLHKKGEVLHFNIEPGDKQEGLNALTLFDLAGNGELQFLYPLSIFNNPAVIRRFPYTSPPMQVTPPFGGDDLVAVLCEKPATDLHNLLEETQPNIPNPNTILSLMNNNRCQVGQYAFFSSE